MRDDATLPALRLRAGFPCRWSVWTEDGRGWFPRGTAPAQAPDGLPYFHGDDVLLRVPAERVTVRAARGMEYGHAQTTLTPGAGETLVELAPSRIYDAAALGWYGGDLNVHASRPSPWVAASQYGEDLHVVNLMSADDESAERWAGRNLPWSDETHVARVGLARSPHAFPRWPPPSGSLALLRERGALIGYANAFRGPVETPEQLLRAGDPGRDARMAVADAALGLVDSYSSAIASAAAYRRLIGAGNRVAAVAGYAHCVGLIGHERTYARVDGPLTAESYARAVRLGRTFATTGPFIELEVNGQGPGATLTLTPGATVSVSARVIGPGVSRIRLLTADGELLSGGPREVDGAMPVVWPTYVVAVAEDGGRVRAHTSPVYLDVNHRRVAREEDVAFCLRWLDLLEELIEGSASREKLALVAEARRVYQARLI